ncbi:rod shape-determining protein MreD [Bacteroidia bacterium]|nr:rod shape-determining protein MreD [Bacteroidia bacterium]GHT87430.1 rod shape-determining protein MreD [Bacteroidia bacterium]
MSSSGIGRIFLFILLVFLQVWLFDKIHLFGYVTPLLYIYFIIKLPGGMNQNVVLLLSALIGLSVDLFEYTLGLNMLACVITGFMRCYLLNLYAPRDIFESYAPSFGSFGAAVFLRYAFLMTLIHHLVLFMTESLTLFDPVSLIFRILGSVILTMFLIFALESINFGVSKK